MTIRHTLLSFATLLLALPATAQDMPDMSPAKERLKFQPLVGNWSGKGTVTEPGPDGPMTMNWTATGSYQWVMNDHWLQEDFSITFEGMDSPLMFRGYWGWDRENARYVGVVASNQGKATLNTAEFLEDGSMVTLARHHDQGVTFVERSTLKVDGDSMSMQIDLMMQQGEMLRMVDGTFEKVDEAAAVRTDAPVFMGVPVHEKVQQFGRIVGVYDVKGQMIPAPGAPAMNIGGTDTYEKWWGGSVVHVKTDGHAEGMPETYEMHAFFAWDNIDGCVKCVFASNMGEVGAMDCRWADDTNIVSTMSGTWMGQPVSQHYVTTLDTDGKCKSASGWTLLGTSKPLEAFQATYTLKK